MNLGLMCHKYFSLLILFSNRYFGIFEELFGLDKFMEFYRGVGLSKEVLQSSDEQMSIHMPGGTESLNVAAAAAVCFFERVRQSIGIEK